MNGTFDKYYEKYDAWYDKHKFAFLSELKAVKKVLPRDERGLEIGVGTGRFAAALGITMGIDPSRNMLEIAKKRRVKVRLGNGEKLYFKNSSFDYVAIIITLCFVKNPLKVLDEARRVLKKNGKIIIGIIDKESFLGKFYQSRKSIFYKQANFFGVREIVDLLKTAGFNKFSYYQTIYKLPDKIRSIQRPKKGFGKGGFIIIGAYKSRQIEAGIYKKFRQYERIRFLFKRYGYDMDQARQKVLERTGLINEPILDVGTGPGRMAYALAQYGYKVTTIDISKEAQEVAKIYAERYKVLSKIKFIPMDAQTLIFKNESFSTTISANLLHDVKNPHKVMQEMIRVTKPHGKVIVSDLNKKGKDLVNKVYRINKEVHKGKPINLKKIVEGSFKQPRINFKEYNDGYISTYIGEKI